MSLTKTASFRELQRFPTLYGISVCAQDTCYVTNSYPGVGGAAFNRPAPATTHIVDINWNSMKAVPVTERLENEGERKRLQLGKGNLIIGDVAMPMIVTEYHCDRFQLMHRDS